MKANTWPVWARLIVSLGILLHGLSVVLSAFGARPPASRLEVELMAHFRPYYELINQGTTHRYYAPEPGPTPIVLARLRFSDGRPETTIRIPDRSRTPRLRYQRHLALANALMEDARAAKAQGQMSLWGRSFARHLCESTPGCSGVTLHTQYHLVPTPGQLLEALEKHGGRAPNLEDESFYTVPERVGEFTCRTN